MATHGMIDLETLGVNPDSVLMTVGAVKFNPFGNAEPQVSLYHVVILKNKAQSLVDPHR